MTKHTTDDALQTLERAAIAELYGKDDEPNDPPAARRYDYTALSTAATCPKQYVYAHVLNVPAGLGLDDGRALEAGEADDISEAGETAGTPDARAVGQLFHTVAEHKWPETTAPTAWKAYAARLAAARGWQDSLPRVEQLIDAFLASKVTDLAVERSRVEVPFAFEFDGRTVTGYIDALPVEPERGHSLVVDHKTGHREPDEEQLLIYLLATHLDDLAGMQAMDAAFLRVAEDGAHLERLGISDIDATLKRAEETLREWIAAADAASYDDATPGAHCTACPYRGICTDADIDGPDR